MFAPSSHDVRRFFMEAWRSHRARLQLEGAARTAAQVVVRHPEYHLLLESTESAQDRQYLPEAGETNPFLHLSLHLAIEEQLSIDQPAGIRAHYLALLRRLGDEHDAQHAILECLAEALWRSQRENMPLDGERYMECVSMAANVKG